MPKINKPNQNKDVIRSVRMTESDLDFIVRLHGSIAEFFDFSLNRLRDETQMHMICNEDEDHEGCNNCQCKPYFDNEYMLGHELWVHNEIKKPDPK